MINKLLSLIGSHLSEFPFKRTRWWSKPYVSYIDISPPLTRENPLWKRSQDELAQILLFNRSPEELGREVENYLKKSRWKRWFFFGMDKKVSLWNFYRRCLRYKVVRNGIPEINEDHGIYADIQYFLDDAIDYSYKYYLKLFDYYSCKGERYDYMSDCYNNRLRWDAMDYLKEKITGLSIENQVFLDNKLEEDSYFIRNLISLIYREDVEFFLDHFFKAFRILKMKEFSTNNLESSSMINEVVGQEELRLLENKKDWVKSKRKDLIQLLNNKEVDQPFLLKNFLETNLDEITNIIESYFEKFDSNDHFTDYKVRVTELEILHRQIKLILRNTALLFHPDHILNLTNSKEVFSLVTEYCQRYNSKGNSYIERLNSYQYRLKEEGDWLKEEGQLPPKELDSIVQAMVKLNQSLHEMKNDHKKQKRDYFDKKNMQDNYIEFLIKSLKQYHIKLPEKNDYGFLIRSIKNISGIQLKKDEWSRCLKLCIEEFEESFNKKNRIDLNRLEAVVKCITDNVFLEKKKFLGNFIFSNELIKLGSDLGNELRACKLKNYEFKAAEKDFLQLLGREDKALKRGILLIKMGLHEAKNKFPYKEDADQKEKKLKNKFHDLSESFFSMREQYDNNEFDNSMSTYRNTKSQG